MPKKNLKIAFIPTEVSGVNFYRVWQPAIGLRESGIQTAVLWYKNDQFYRDNWEQDISTERYQAKIVGDIEKACEWADVVVWQGLHGSEPLKLYLHMKRRHPQKPFVMEMDDDVFMLPSYNAASEGLRPGSGNTMIYMDQMANSDAMIVSTPHLKEAYSKMFKKKIYVVENHINLSLWRRQSSPATPRVNIGWVGGATHTEDIEMIREPIFEILGKYPKVKFTFLHGIPESLKHKEGCRYLNSSDPTYLEYFKSKRCVLCKGIDRIEWTHDFSSIDKYPEWVKKWKFDIGIAPLKDNNFNRSKSNLRWLEYSAQGIPSVCSPLKHFVQTVEHGRTGFIANNSVEWVRHLSELIDNTALRKRIGDNALKEVRKNWNSKLLGGKYEKIFKEISQCRR